MLNLKKLGSRYFYYESQLFKVDVIVNSAPNNLHLSTGQLSAALLKAAGQTIQQECTSKYPVGVQDGDVGITSGGNLSCKYIYHAVCPHAKENRTVGINING